MDNAKMGELIRSARKEIGLTQKDVAEKLGITDRAVSKWERGICAPDIAYIEELAQMLGLTVAELIAGERMEQPPAEEIENVIKETISYSQNEMDQRSKAAGRKLWLVSIIAIVLTAVLCLGVLWYRGHFNVIGRYPSPDGSTVTTVFDCRMGYRDPPSPGGFTLSDEGRFAGRTIYENATFRGLWWSPNGCYQVVSMYQGGEIYLSLADFTRNTGNNLTSRLNTALYQNEFFDDVPMGEDGRKDISFEFIQWSEADPETMLVYFFYTNTDGQFQDGYMWYDYEAHEASGYMKLKQGEKETESFYDLIGDLMS